MTEARLRVAIVGGGIAGLAAAYRLERLCQAHGRDVEVQLFERQQRLGGAIRSEEHDGFLVEAGPDSFLTAKPWALELASELGLQSRIVHTQERFRRTFVAQDGKLHPLPAGFLLLAPTAFGPLLGSRLFTLAGKARMALELFLPRAQRQPDESLASFVTRRFGREALERVAQPLIGGIYLAKAEELSLAATMPRFLEMEQEHRSVILAMRREAQRTGPRQSGARWNLFASFDRGLQVLVDALAQSLRRTRITLGIGIRRLERGKGWRVVLDDGSCLLADAVILATPARRAGVLLDDSCSRLRAELAGIETTPSLTISLAFPSEQVGKMPETFGFVVPRTEKQHLWACTISSRKYPGRAPSGKVLFRAFYGGADQEELLGREDAELIQLAISEIGTWIPLSGTPELAIVRRYPIGLPLYRVGHLQRVQRIRDAVAAVPGLALAGNSYEGVGIPDCVRSGQQAVEKIWNELRQNEQAVHPHQAAGFR